VSLYDNELFKLKQFVDNERSFKTVTEESIAVCQDTFGITPVMLQQLELEMSISRSALREISGLDPKEFSKILSLLISKKLVRSQGDKISPTPRFLGSMNQITRQLHLKKGEEHEF
jgi:hypothetical protein